MSSLLMSDGVVCVITFRNLWLNSPIIDLRCKNG